MFYEQLLRGQIPKVQKRQLSCQSLKGSACAKATRRTLMKLTLGDKKYDGISSY